MNTIYLAKASVKITTNKPNVNYKPLLVKGLFMPKTKTRKHSYVEEKIRENIPSNLQQEHPDLTFQVSRVKIESFSYDFVINEKQHS